MLIYKITNEINGKIYIGQTTTTLRERWKDHCRVKNRQMTPFKHSIQKYGKENFIVQVIDRASNLIELTEKETHWIKFYNSTDRNIGYNIKLEGGPRGRLPQYVKDKMSASKKGVGKGFKHSDETKRKWSEIRKGRPSPLKGIKRDIKLSPEVRRKISESNKGIPKHNRFKSTNSNSAMLGIILKGDFYSVKLVGINLGSYKDLNKAQSVRDDFIKLAYLIDDEHGKPVAYTKSKENIKMILSRFCNEYYFEYLERNEERKRNKFIYPYYRHWQVRFKGTLLGVFNSFNEAFESRSSLIPDLDSHLSKIT